jgi:pyridoxamine 5'-phosphate oxidase family protein
MFSEQENAYLKTQRLARIATVSQTFQPDVAPVGFEFDGTCLYVGGLDNPSTRKYKNVTRGNTKGAIVIDDLESIDPWKPRFIKSYGVADVIMREGQRGTRTYIRITPQVKWSFGIDGPRFQDGKPVIKKTTRT